MLGYKRLIKLDQEFGADNEEIIDQL